MQGLTQLIAIASSAVTLAISSVSAQETLRIGAPLPITNVTMFMSSLSRSI